MIIVENCCEKNQVPQIFLYLFVAELHRRKLQLFLFSATRGNFDKKKGPANLTTERMELHISRKLW